MKSMTATEFVLKVREIAKQQPRPVLAVDFRPAKDGVEVQFRFKE